MYAAIIVFILLFSVLLFTFFHESGHAILGLLFGAKITSFSVDFIGMSAHVGLDAAFSPVQQALVSLGGFSLPLILTITFLLCAPLRSNMLVEWLKILSASVSISSLLAWIVLPWIYLTGGRPGDDSITFLMVTGIYPPLVSGAVGLIFTGAAAIFIKRIEGYKGILARFRAQPADLLTPAARKTLAIMVIIFFVVAAVAVGLGAAYGTSKANFLLAPADYTSAATIKLSEHKLENETAYSFTLQNPSSVSLFFAMEGLTRGPGKISLKGPDGYENVFFSADEKASGNFTVHPKNLSLEAGAYQVMLTFPQDRGVLKIYQKVESNQP
jgi:hypothetical protein